MRLTGIIEAGEAAGAPVERSIAQLPDGRAYSAVRHPIEKSRRELASERRSGQAAVVAGAASRPSSSPFRGKRSPPPPPPFPGRNLACEIEPRGSRARAGAGTAAARWRINGGKRVRGDDASEKRKRGSWSLEVEDDNSRLVFLRHFLFSHLMQRFF